MHYAALSLGTGMELFLQGAVGKGDIGNDAALELALQRSLRFSREWHDDPHRPEEKKKRS
jgi:hypothetical protein